MSNIFRMKPTRNKKNKIRLSQVFQKSGTHMIVNIIIFLSIYFDFGSTALPFKIPRDRSIILRWRGRGCNKYGQGGGGSRQ